MKSLAIDMLTESILTLQRENAKLKSRITTIANEARAERDKEILGEMEATGRDWDKIIDYLEKI